MEFKSPYIQEGSTLFSLFCILLNPSLNHQMKSIKNTYTYQIHVFVLVFKLINDKNYNIF